MAVSLVPVRRRSRGGRPHRNMVLDYQDDLRIFPSRWAKAGLVLLAFLYWYIPTVYFPSQHWDTPFFRTFTPSLRTFSTIGIFAIGAIGLNLLSGFTGQISLGHAFFVGVGAYTVGYLGATQEMPLYGYLPIAALLGFGLGAIIGPFALRLRGTYLVIVTIGVVFLGQHVFRNWDSVTGGNRRLDIRDAEMSIGSLDFNDLQLFGHEYDRDGGLFFLVWALVALSALLAKNIVRSRPGRAMQAVRDRDLSAEVIGVNLARTKVAAFAWAGGFASVAGVLYGLQERSVAKPDPFDLLFSIEFVAIMIIGGVGTIFGPILGAVFLVGGEDLIRQNSQTAILEPLVTDPGWFTVGELNGILFGLAVVLFLLFESRGVAALWLRLKTWVLTWPFRY